MRRRDFIKVIADSAVAWPLVARFVVFLALVPAGLLLAKAEPTVHESITYYDVSGTTAVMVRNHLNSIRPKNERNGISYDAITRWYVSWRYTYRNGAHGCAIAEVTTTVDVNITMPRLANEASTTAELVRMFADYAEKLLVHEKGHGKTGIDAARRIEDGIRALPSQRSCDEVARTANALGYSLIKEANRLDAEYDIRTQHGRTQGARFP